MRRWSGAEICALVLAGLLLLLLVAGVAEKHQRGEGSASTTRHREIER